MNNLRVAGIDVSRNWIVLTILESFPSPSLLALFNSLKSPADWATKRESRQINAIQYHLEPDATAIKILGELGLDIAILEPTGIWYAQFWIDALERLGVKVCWVSHLQVKVAREHYGLPNKDDRSDSLAIASIFFDQSNKDELGNPPLISRFNHNLLIKLKTIYFERRQLDKLNNLLSNQLKQRLSREFPEISERDLLSRGAKGCNPTLGHLLGLIQNKRFPKTTVGTGIDSYTVNHAQRLHQSLLQIWEIEDKASFLLADLEVKEYRKVFVKFGFGLPLQIILMVHTYPLDKFFLEGQPYRKNGHDQSLRKFQSYLGLGYTYSKSGSLSADGKQNKKSWRGSTLVRSSLYAHLLVTVCNPKKEPSNEIQLKLKKAWLEPRVDPKSGEKFPSFKSLGKDGVCRLLFYESRLLYQELLRAMN